jgi:hypothetical protein
MYKLILLIISSVIILLWTDKLYAEGSTGTSGADFLELGVGSRPLSMAEAFTAEVGDINSLYYNPAGLGSLRYPVL